MRNEPSLSLSNFGELPSGCCNAFHESDVAQSVLEP